MSTLNLSALQHQKTRDFRKFWIGETISNLGSSFTQFALPLLIFKLTGSALNLGLATAITHLPYLFFGLLIGAWADRLDRKRMMRLVDLGQAVLLTSIPVLFLLGALSIWWIYVVGFISGTLKIFFDAGQFAALPSLVEQHDLAIANGRVQASFFGATIVGPLLAGTLLFLLPVPALFFVDAGSFLVSAVTLSLIASTFNLAEKREQKRIWSDVAEGLRHIFRHPILRIIPILLVPVNFSSSIAASQLVLFSERQLHATDTQFALINAAGSTGVIVAALGVARILKRVSFTRLLIPTLALFGGAIAAMSLVSSVWLAMPCWAMALGCEQFFNICTVSLRQTIVPNQLLGRVSTVNAVVAWSAIPLGSLAGGTVIKATGNVMLVYLGVGAVICSMAMVASFTALRHTKRYLPKQREEPQPEAGSQAAF